MKFFDALKRSILPNVFIEDIPPEQFNESQNGFKTLIDIFGLKNTSTPNASTAHLFNDIYACVNVLSDDIAKLPIKVYKNNQGDIERLSEHPVQYLLGIRPNEYMTPFTFKKMIVCDVCFSGNFYALKEFDKQGKVIALHPLTSTSTQVVVDENKGVFYYVTI
ncbi:phage portal protein [Granulicatella sp. zg-ZJ]|uniref:phage portal protein n=1 Tax=Granulicatella sp. zg-ZJ TaxID=2678504 RepID=UPI0013D33790|nr:phage portal protein [Granulicatella sp. zg-ZJ]NEW63465.1 phage portal protein [Granulicatella sp. zg-ZJ]